MELVFWQNIVSHLQLPYLKELSKEHVVCLVVPEHISKERKEMGWRLLDAGNIRIEENPNGEKINQLFDEFSKAIHFFSGISGFSFIRKAFIQSLNYNIRRGLIVEKPYTYKKPILFHAIKTFFTDYKYFPYISYVFAIGDEAVKWYKLWNKNWKIFNIPYTVSQPEYKKSINNKDFHLLYVGSLSSRKNVLFAVKVIGELNNQSLKLFIIGAGLQENAIREYIKRKGLSERIILLGTKDNTELLRIISNYDGLILPSLHDGWGAVLNEGLMAGCYTICSDRCGAKVLIKDDIRRGKVFKSNNKRSLKKSISHLILNEKKIKQDREYRHQWSQCLTGERVAKYFITSIQFENDTTVKAVWEQ